MSAFNIFDQALFRTIDQAPDRRDPPKYSVAQVVGYIKGNLAISVARTFLDHKRSLVGQHF